MSVRDLVVSYPVRGSGFGRGRTRFNAVDGVSFDVHASETVALVGESGCGKSTIARAIMGLERPASGSIEFRGTDLGSLRGRRARRFRRSIQIVFQDPYASLDPRQTVGASIGEPLAIHRIASGSGARARVEGLLELVGLSRSDRERYPRDLSGGQRQRVAIARALAVEPELLICDEPVTALDVSIQAQILNLIADLQGEFGLSVLFIAHDLAVVRSFSDRVAVMHLGRIVEVASAVDLYRRPEHPYSRALLSAAPTPDPRVERARNRIVLEGEPPSPIDPPDGCRFRTRCWKANDLCRDEVPVLIERGPDRGHRTACHFPESDPVS